MSRYTNIDGNYTVSVTDGGTITLDVGPNSSGGQVIVTGDLVIQGETFEIETTELQIEDRIITLNRVTGVINAVPGRVAGIEIYRGTSDEVYWVFDEDVENGPGNLLGYGAWAARKGTPDASGSTLLGVQTNSIDTKGASLYLINQGSSGIVTVEGVVDYEKRVFNYTDSTTVDIADPLAAQDGLTNAKSVVNYVDSFFAGRFQDRVEEGSTSKTFVEVHDVEVAGILPPLDPGFRDESQIEFGVDGNTVSRFFNDRVELQHIKITDTTIESTSGGDIVLSAPGGANVTVNDTLLLRPGPWQDDSTFGVDGDTLFPDPPVADVGTTSIKVYAATESIGGTGLHFVNSNNTKDEIISRNRAILYSMIF